MKEIGLKDKLKGEKLSSPETLASVAVLVALYTILSFFAININAVATIRFSYMEFVAFGMLFVGTVGFVFVLLLYKKPVKIKRTMSAVLIVMPVWINMMYGLNAITLPRINRNIILYPGYVIGMSAVLKGVFNFRKSVA